MKSKKKKQKTPTQHPFSPQKAKLNHTLNKDPKIVLIFFPPHYNVELIKTLLP